MSKLEDEDVTSRSCVPVSKLIIRRYASNAPTIEVTSHAFRADSPIPTSRSDTSEFDKVPSESIPIHIEDWNRMIAGMRYGEYESRPLRKSPALRNAARDISFALDALSPICAPCILSETPVLNLAMPSLRGPFPSYSSCSQWSLKSSSRTGRACRVPISNDPQC